MDKNIFKNYIYNLGYQVILLVVPVIVSPYISRVLGAELIGAYSFTQSIVSYFILLGSFGINMYGQREIAYVQDDKGKRSQVFWEILILRGVTIGCSLLFYLVMVRIYGKYSGLFLIQSIDILAVAVDITWFFQGIEQFKAIIIRNVVVRVLSVISVFIFVKTSKDLALYVAIMTISIFIGNISLWSYAHDYIDKIEIRKLSAFKHFRGSIQLFLPQVAIQIYLVLDKTMLGFMTPTTIENGYYEQAQKVVKMLLAVVTSLGMVMASRIAVLYAKEQITKIKEYIVNSFRLVFFLGVPMLLGLIVVADSFVPLFFGPGYTKTIILIKILSILILFIGLSNVVGNQLLIPTGAQKIVTYTVLAGAILNIILNRILIPSHFSIGAAVASVITEGVITLYQFYCIKDIVHIKEILKMSRRYLMSGGIMFFVLKYVGRYVGIEMVSLVIQVLIGGITYIGILMLIKLRKNEKQVNQKKNP